MQKAGLLKIKSKQALNNWIKTMLDEILDASFSYILRSKIGIIVK